MLYIERVFVSLPLLFVNLSACLALESWEERKVGVEVKGMVLIEFDKSARLASLSFFNMPTLSRLKRKRMEEK